MEIISNYVDSLFPDAKCELFYNRDYELVIAVMLSAQTTDKAVNLVTKKLFEDYKSLSDIDNAPIEDIEEHIKTLGLYKNKAKNVIGIAKTLVDKFNGVVPQDKEELQTLPGIGNKSAGVVRAEIFHIPDLPVDTHILRISKRFSLVSKDANPYETEQKLKKLIDESRWIKTHHQLIHFGRYLCTARKPSCDSCRLAHICNK